MIKRNSENPFVFFYVLIALSLVLIGGERFRIWSFGKRPVEIVLTAPRKVLYSISILVQENLSILLKRNLRQKISQNRDLSRELLVLKNKLQLLEEENNTLRKQLEAPLPAQWDFLPAQVIGLDRFLLIDKGSDDKITKDMVVISENIVVGKIHSVSQQTARVILPGDPDFKISAITNRFVKGLLIGEFGNKVLLSRVLQKDTLNSLDLVLTSGEEGTFPADLLIGRINKVNAREGEVYKEATVDLLLNSDQLRRVFVVTSY